MEIRKAKSEDAEALSRIAFAAKSYWKYPERWLALWKESLTITGQFIVENEVYTMTEKDQIVGFYALTIDGAVGQLEHLWVSPEFIGSGIGKKLFAHALEKAVSYNAKILNIDSDPNAEEFYVKMGAKRVGNIVTEIEGNERILPLMQILL